jgi:tetratricopeptide (TPR) repeat protein
VPNEPAISEDLEQYDDKEELRRLIRAVKFSQKHYLYFACCNQVPKQNELIAETKKNLKGKPIKVVKFKKPITDLLGELQKKTIGADCEAVFVQGLEYSISSDAKGAENALIHNLNISRDSFKKYLSCPLFLWLPEYAIVKITRHAPDFFSVRSGTFYFSNPPEKVTEQIFQSVSSSFIEDTSLSFTEKVKQIETLQSLLAEYRGLHPEKQDKQTEIQLLGKLAGFFESISEYQNAIKHYDQALILSRKISNRQNECISLNNLGVAYHKLGELKKAIKYYEESLTIARNIDDQQGIGISLGCLGIAYTALGEYQKGIGYLEQYLALSRRINDIYGIGTSLHGLGNIYSNLGDYQKGIEYHEQALSIKRQIGDRAGESKSMGSLGIDYQRLGESQKAIEYLQQHLIISNEIGDREGERLSLNNLGNVYSSLGEYQKAIEYYQQAIHIARKINNRRGVGVGLQNLGNAYFSLGEEAKACDLWKEALTILEAVKAPNANDVRKKIKENGC